MYRFEELDIIHDEPVKSYKRDEFIRKDFVSKTYIPSEYKIKGRPYRFRHSLFGLLVLTPIELIMSWPLISLIGLLMIFIIKFILVMLMF
jgi:hypothetical protein